MTPRAAEKPPLVLVHGFTAGPSVWDPVTSLLEERFTLHALTVAGHRGGTVLTEPPSVTAMAADLEAQLDRLGLADAHLVGNSLGGWLALMLAGRGRARSVVALAPAGGWKPESLFEKRVLAQFFSAYAGARLVGPSLPGLVRRPRFRRALLEATVTHPERVSIAAATEIVEDLVGCTALGPFLRTPANRAFEQLDAIDVPSLIAWSGADKVLLAKYARSRFDELLPDARQIELPGAGHVPMSDAPELVATTISDFAAAAG